MASNEEFDFSSDEENFENDWKFDENDDISGYINASTTQLTTQNDKAVENLGINTKIVAESSSNVKKVSRMDLNTAKAGMEGLDKEKINQIIHEASKGSRYYENEKKKEKQVQKRIEELQRKMASFTNEQKVKAKQTADKVVQELEQGRDLSRTIVHIDMDAFYAAVEMRDDPSLKSKPMAVGGSAMLCTSNYLARRYGVRAGMPGFIAKKLCSNLTIVPTNFDKYTKISHEIREVLAEYDRNFLPMSLDEAYLDITGYLRNIEEQEKRMSKVNDQGSRKIEVKRDTDTKDTDIKEIVCNKAKENDNIKRESVKDERLVAVKQETDKTETLPNQDFEQVTKQVKMESDFDVIKYKPDEKNSEGLYEAHETEAKGMKNDKKLDSVSKDVEHVTNQLKTVSAGETTKYERGENSVNQQKLECMISTGRSEVQGQKSALDLEQSLNENESDTSLLQEEPVAAEQDMFYNKVEAVVKEMRRKIEEKTQLTASAGIAPNMFLAKVCSDKNKPNGQFYLKPERDKIMDFVRELPLRKAFGIGRVSEQILTSVLKVNTCSELHDRRDLMQLLFTQTACRNYLEISLGLGSTVVDVDRERKSMSTETTFKEINKPEEHFAKCHVLCQELSDSLKAHALTARKIGIKLKTINFEVKTRVSTASLPVRETEEIFSHAKKLLVNEIRSCSPEPLRLRLMGVRAAELSEEGMVGGSKQPTIISLMKKSGSIRHHSTNMNASQTAGSSDAYAPKQDEVSFERGYVSRVDEVRNSESCSDLMVSDDHPSTSKQYTNDQVSDQLERHSLQQNVKPERPCSVADRDISKEKPSTFNCPVCGKDLTFTSGNALLQMNQHVDMCLKKQAATGVLKYDSGQQTNKSKQTSKKRKRESSSNPNKSPKRKPMDRFLTKHTK